MPYPDFKKSAKVLDRARLGKQRVEVLQLVRVLSGQTSGWKRHPCTTMWVGAKNALIEYGVAMCDEWISREYKDTVREKLLVFLDPQKTTMPHWLGWEPLHASHRANLLRKDSSWYSQFGWKDFPLLPYEWPRNEPIYPVNSPGVVSNATPTVCSSPVQK